MFPKSKDWDIKYTSKGLVKKRMNTVLKYSMYMILLTGAIRAKRAGLNLMDVPRLAKGYSRAALMMAAGLLQSLGSKF